MSGVLTRGRSRGQGAAMTAEVMAEVAPLSGSRCQAPRCVSRAGRAYAKAGSSSGAMAPGSARRARVPGSGIPASRVGGRGAQGPRLGPEARVPARAGYRLPGAHPRAPGAWLPSGARTRPARLAGVGVAGEGAGSPGPTGSCLVPEARLSPAVAPARVAGPPDARRPLPAAWQHPFLNVFRHFRVDEWKRSAKQGDVAVVTVGGRGSPGAHTPALPPGERPRPRGPPQPRCTSPGCRR